MCVNFFAVEIAFLSDDAKDIDHDGKPYTNPDFSKGTILSTDASGNVYKLLRSVDDETSRLSGSWPTAGAKGISLFRNYWNFIYNPKGNLMGAPYYRAIHKTPKTIIKTA